MTKCHDYENCVAYESNCEECKKDNGCMTEENVKVYLEWCDRVMKKLKDRKI